MDLSNPARAVPVLDYAPPIKGRKLSRILRKLIAILILPLLGAVVGAGLAWLFGPVHYVAEALIYVEPAAQANRGNLLYTVAALVESQSVLSVAKKTSVGDSGSPADWERAQISAQVERQSDFIRISVLHRGNKSAVAIDRAMLEAAVSQIESQGIAVATLVAPTPATVLAPVRDLRFIVIGSLLGGVAGLIVFAARLKRTNMAQSLGN